MAKNSVTIFLDENNSMYLYDERIDEETNEEIHNIMIVTDKESDFKEVLYDKESFQSGVSINQLDMTYEEFFEKEYELEINGNCDDVIYFINNNDIPCKKILVGSSENGKLHIKDDEYVSKLIEKIKEPEKIYINAEENSENVSLMDYKETIDTINKMIEKVKSKNLSPFEQLIYIYDLVRDRKYKESETDNPYSSRDITPVLKGEEIVCIGYSEIFDAIVKKLGYISIIQILHNSDNTSGHARNMVYIKDDKHNVDGIFVFDLTMGRKIDNSNKHFNNYYYCARPNAFFEFADEKKKLDLIYDAKIVLKEIYDKVEHNEFDIDLMNFYAIFSIYSDLTGKNIIEPEEYQKLSTSDKVQEKFRENLIEFCKLMDKRITKEDYLRALTNVRVAEYYEDSDKFPISLDIIEELSPTTIGNDKKLILEDEEIGKKINMIRLSKTLRKVIEKKNN